MAAALPFVQLIREAGIRKLRRKRRYLRVKQEIPSSTGKRITHPARRPVPPDLRHFLRSSRWWDASDSSWR